ncbi:MAG: AMP-binding protein, partial [Lysobacter sp.]|nr:AMP-binding protein [Lysobacter sp.]
MSVFGTFLARMKIRAVARKVEAARSLRDIQRFAFAAHLDKPALSTPSAELSYRDIEDRALRLVGAWRAAGVRKDSRVVVLLGDDWPQLVVRFAATEAGVVLVGFNSAHAALFMSQTVRDLAPALLMVDLNLLPRDFAETHAAAGGAPVWDCAPNGDLASRLAASTPTLSDEELGPDDTLALGFTSGTSGTPKMLALKHEPYLHSVRLLLLNLTDPPRERSRTLVGIPLSGAGSGVVLPTLLSGGQLVLPSAYTTDALIDALRAHRPTHMFVTPSLLIDLLDHPDLAVADLASMRQVIYGSATMPVAKLREAIARFGLIFQQGYGMSEALPPIAMLSPEEHVDDGLPPPDSVLSSSGRIARGVGLEVRDDNDRAVPAGTIGKIWVRSPTVFEGYVDRPDLNRDVLRDRWYFTGDYGYYDASARIHVLDRQQNVIDLPQGRIYPR